MCIIDGEVKRRTRTYTGIKFVSTMKIKRPTLVSYTPMACVYRFGVVVLLLPAFLSFTNLVFFSQNSGVEMTWVIADFTATAPRQLTVTKGQQVELLDCCGGLSDMVLVRVPSDCTEGMVPHIVLKQPPSLKSPQTAGKRRFLYS